MQGSPAAAQKKGGTLRLYHNDNPPSTSLLEESTIASVMPFAAVFNNLVTFDPAKVQDHATFEKPQQLSTGVRDVFVNGTQVLKDGKHTGAKPGRFVRGPGWTGWPDGGACK